VIGIDLVADLQAGYSSSTVAAPLALSRLNIMQATPERTD
jgi:hypothetical protein